MELGDCMGCTCYVGGEWCTASYIHIEAKNVKSCACKICLVKPMCNNVCDDFWNEKMNPSDCVGCICYFGEKCCLAVSMGTKSIKSCPCTTCLVRVMCNNVCDEFWKVREEEM